MSPTRAHLQEVFDLVDGVRMGLEPLTQREERHEFAKMLLEWSTKIRNRHREEKNCGNGTMMCFICGLADGAEAAKTGSADAMGFFTGLLAEADRIDNGEKPS